MIRTLLACILTAAILCLGMSSALARNVALVIGNAAYLHDSRLSNPGNDARRMASVLGDLGYEVTVQEDLGVIAMDRALVEFAAKARGADRAVVFYSGHGIEIAGTNYLIPIDARLEESWQARRQAIDLRAVQEAVSGARQLSVIILDACRNNNFAGSKSAGSKGLGRPEPMSGQVVAYAARAGTVAWNGSSDLSPYTRALSERLLANPGEDVRILFSSLASKTREYAGREQVPDMQASQFPPGATVTLASAVKRPPPSPSDPYPDLSVFRDCADCPEMVVVPGGAFLMGSPESEEGRNDDEGPQRRVTIQKFALARTEVTVGSYQQFLKETGHEPDPGCWQWDRKEREWKENKEAGWSAPGFEQTDAHPVACVNWSDAKVYIEWLNGKVAGSPYRLPIESEWEYAARAGTMTQFSFGDTISTSQANYRGTSTYGDGVKGPYRQRTVGVEDLDAANGWGLRHMHGNVWEWTEDCWHANYEGAPSDGRAWLSEQDGNCSLRVVRGGSWFFIPQNLRSANRSRVRAVDRDNNVGFRPARTLLTP